MVYSGTEFLTSDDDSVALKDLLAYIQKNIDLKDIYNDLKRINELKLELDALNQAAQISIKNLDKKLDSHEHPQIELPDTYTKVETAVLLEKLKGQLKKQIETLPRVTQNDLQGVVDLLRTDLEKAIKAIPKEKPSTTIIEQKLDDKRIDALEEQQKEVLAVIDGVIDNAADELKEVQEKLMKELEKRIKEKNKKVTIIGGVSAGKDNLRELLDVAITTPTNGQSLVYNSTTQKFENGTVTPDLTPYARLDGTNQPFTGAIEIQNNGAAASAQIIRNSLGDKIFEILDGGELAYGGDALSGAFDPNFKSEVNRIIQFIKFINLNTSGRTIMSVGIDDGAGGGATFDLRAHGTGYNETLFGIDMVNKCAMIAQGGEEFVIGNYGYYAMIFGTADAERMRIDADGNVGIATVPSGSYTLEVSGTGNFTGDLSANNLSGTNTGDQDLSAYATTTAVTAALAGIPKFTYFV